MVKKGQMEVIGLVIIVILITLGMLFLAQFALKEESQKKAFVGKNLAYSTMGALMKTNAFCYDYGGVGGIETKKLALGEKLLDDCAASYQEPSKSTFMCSNKHSCLFLEQEIGGLLNKTLGKWNRHYQFSSSLIQGAKLITLVNVTDEKGKGCPGERDTSTPFPLSTPSGTVESILYICN